MISIDEMIILAAPSCCGKSRFLDESYSGRLDDIWRTVGIKESLPSYLSVMSGNLKSLMQKQVSHMILHYALPTIAINEGSLQDLVDDPRLALVDRASTITILTLIAHPEIMVSRVDKRHREHRLLMLKNPAKYLSERKRLMRLGHLYKESENLKAVYEAWFDYCDALPNVRSSWILTANDAYTLHERREWSTIEKLYF